jgi:hypothetical protein
MTPRKVDPSKPKRQRGRPSDIGHRSMKQTAHWDTVEQIEAAKQAANAAGITYSEFIREAIREKLGRARRSGNDD